MLRSSSLVTISTWSIFLNRAISLSLARATPTARSLAGLPGLLVGRAARLLDSIVDEAREHAGGVDGLGQQHALGRLAGDELEGRLKVGDVVYGPAFLRVEIEVGELRPVGVGIERRSGVGEDAENRILLRRRPWRRRGLGERVQHAQAVVAPV